MFNPLIDSILDFQSKHQEVSVEMAFSPSHLDIPATIEITVTDDDDPTAWVGMMITSDLSTYATDESDDMDEDTSERLNALADNLLLDYIRKA